MLKDPKDTIYLYFHRKDQPCELFNYSFLNHYCLLIPYTLIDNERKHYIDITQSFQPISLKKTYSDGTSDNPMLILNDPDIQHEGNIASTVRSPSSSTIKKRKSTELSWTERAKVDL